MRVTLSLLPVLILATTDGYSQVAPTPAKLLEAGQWLDPSKYPAKARQSGEQGSVKVAVAVTAKGLASSCNVIMPGRLKTLEPHTCNTIMTKARFSPARDANGRDVATIQNFVIQWSLPTGKHPLGGNIQPSGPMDVTVFGDVDENDKVSTKRSVIGGEELPILLDWSAQKKQLRQLRDALKISGSYRVAVHTSFWHGDTAPQVPGPTINGRSLALVEARHTIDADGQPSLCAVRATGEYTGWVEEFVRLNACNSGTRFTPVLGPDGKGRSQQMLIVTRYILLPQMK